MKKIITIAVVVSLLISSFIAAEGASEDSIAFEDLGNERGYINITNASPVDVEIQIAENWDIRIEGSREAIEDLEIQRRGDTLRIDTESRLFGNFNGGNVIVYISMPTISKLINSGSGDVNVSGVIRGDSLQLINSGAGDVQLQARVENFSVTSSGAGDMSLRAIAEDSELRMTGAGDIDIALVSMNSEITLTGAGDISVEGQTDEAEIRLTGAGSLYGEDFVIQNADLVLTGVGSAYITAMDEISAVLTGVGGVSYRGTAEVTNMRNTGLGRVERIHD